MSCKKNDEENCINTPPASLVEGSFEANESILIGIRGFFVKFEVNGT